MIYLCKWLSNTHFANKCFLVFALCTPIVWDQFNLLWRWNINVSMPMPMPTLEMHFTKAHHTAYVVNDEMLHWIVQCIQNGPTRFELDGWKRVCGIKCSVCGSHSGPHPYNSIENKLRDIITMAMPTIESAPTRIAAKTNYIRHENIHVKYYRTAKLYGQSHKTGINYFNCVWLEFSSCLIQQRAECCAKEQFRSQKSTTTNGREL